MSVELDEVDKQRMTEIAARIEDRRRSENQLLEAQRVGMRTAFLFQLAVNIGIALAMQEFIVYLAHVLVLIALLLFNTAIAGWVSAPIGFLSARIAHLWFHPSAISVNRMTSVIALIFNSVVLGWAIVLIAALRQDLH